MPNCSRCGSSRVIKNGHIHNGKAKFACKVCRWQFVENPEWKPISEETNALIDKLLERISLAGIGRATGYQRNESLAHLVRTPWHWSAATSGPP